MTYSANQINTKATEQGLQVDSSVQGVFEPKEYKTVSVKRFVTAFFLMNDDFTYTYSHTYNALKDTTYKRLPKGF